MFVKILTSHNYLLCLYQHHSHHEHTAALSIADPNAMFEITNASATSQSVKQLHGHANHWQLTKFSQSACLLLLLCRQVCLAEKVYEEDQQGCIEYGVEEHSIQAGATVMDKCRVPKWQCNQEAEYKLDDLGVGDKLLPLRIDFD